jgi:DNA-binding NtrC family response regulator
MTDKRGTAGQRHILIVEDQETERRALERVLRLAHYEVVTAASAEEALDWRDQPIDLVISDLKMGRQTGIDLLMQWREVHPDAPFILATAFGDVDSAVRAMKLGASDYLTKPIDPTRLLASVREVLSERAASASSGSSSEASSIASSAVTSANRTKTTPATGTSSQPPGLGRLIGHSRPMQEVFDRIRRVAPTDSIVLILGESGTGKELVAAAVHQLSSRAAGPYVAVNMAAIPAHLVESELFGHVRGAFTGATDARVGRFQVASGGTIFIDEIGDFDPAAQAKLLRVLESYTVCPIGSNTELPVDVRVVAATSRNLQDLVAHGQFREDLYYRLNVVAIRLPALRDRPDDIPLLAEVFLNESRATCGRSELSLDPAVVNYFVRHPWPGNVRQLRNVIFSMVVMAEGPVLTLTDLPLELRDAAPPSVSPLAGSISQDLQRIERAHILSTLQAHAGNRTHAAAALRISVRTLQRKLKSWGLENFLHREAPTTTVTPSES